MEPTPIQALEYLFSIVRQVPMTADQHDQAMKAAQLIAESLQAPPDLKVEE
jgi:hypothetical protein